MSSGRPPSPPDRFDRAGLPRLVIFDVDGTLQDTMSWWPKVLPDCLRAFGAKIGVDLPVPDEQAVFGVLGKADEDIWGALLPAAHRHRWRELRALVVPVEVATLHAGRDHLFPGTTSLLGTLRAAGCRIALASNCRQPYFDAVLAGQGLDRLVDAAYCLDSPGVASKEDMVRRAVEGAGTRDAVMVGDRATDGAAAAGHGIPFVLRAGFHAAGEVAAEAVATSQDGILDVLRGRARLLRRVEARLSGAGRIAVTGPPGSGKTLLAARLGALLDRPVLGLDDFGRAAGGSPPGGDHLGHGLDLGALGAALDRDPAGLVEGLFLEDRRLRSRFDAVVHLVAAPDRLAARLRARDGEAAARALYRQWLPAWRDFGPHHEADPSRVWVDTTSAVRPRVVGRGCDILP